MEQGPQGGQHVFVSVRLYARSNDKWLHELFLTGPGGEELGRSSFKVPVCSPAWNMWSPIMVFAHTPTVTGGLLSIRSSPVDDARAVTATVSIEIDPVQ